VHKRKANIMFGFIIGAIVIVLIVVGFLREGEFDE
jgi:hypothetical protein